MLRDDDSDVTSSSSDYFHADRRERAAQKKAEQKGKLTQFKRDLLKKQIGQKPDQEKADKKEDEPADKRKEAPVSDRQEIERKLAAQAQKQQQIAKETKEKAQGSPDA